MAPKKKDAKGKKKKEPPLPKEGPKELPPAKEGRSFQHNEWIGESEDGLSLQHLRGGRSDAAFGVHILQEGVTRFTYTIKRSGERSGYGMVLGIADASPKALKLLNDRRGDMAWGINPTTGRYSVTLDAYQRGQLGEPLVHMFGGLAESGLKRQADGAVITVQVDMGRRKLSFGVNGSPLVVCPVRLPEAVRPWVLLNWEEDAVVFSEPQKLDQIADLP